MTEYLFLVSIIEGWERERKVGKEESESEREKRERKVGT
jgi:hypothetical protein